MSIGSKFALVSLITPISVILVSLPIAYGFYPNPFLPILTAALLSADVLIWRELRATLRARMVQVWTHSLKEIRDRVGEVVVGSTYFFPDNGWGLEDKIEWVTKYGKYGPVRLYPKKLVKLKLVSKLIPAGEDFNSKLKAFSTETKSLDLYYAFDHWGFRKVPPDVIERQGASTLATQKEIHDTLDQTKKQEITELTQSWKKALALAKQIVSILDRFSSENGIMPPNPTPFVPLAHY